MSLDPSPDCACQKCVECCTREPGRFGPGEAEKAAALLGLPFDEFKRKFLVKDYWSGGACCWAPRKLGVSHPSDPDEAVAYSYAFAEGKCVFLKRGRCKIHEAKPIECRVAMGCSDTEANAREEINALWVAAGSPLDQSPEADLGESIGAMLDMFRGRW